MDSAYIQEKDVEYVNKLRAEQGKHLFEPLYTQNDVISAMKQFVGISYGRRRRILPGVDLTLVDAGHMLGSSSVILDIDDLDAGRGLRLAFSGDIGRPDIPILEDPVPIEDGADILLVESTYGNRHHPSYPEAEEELRRVITETYDRGGFLLIPAFAVGRTQQIVYALHRLHNENRIPDVPVYVDSPLATRATEVFRLHPETYDAEIRAFLMQDDDRNPFGFASLRYTRSVEESKELNTMTNPAVVISASGMMEGGRILHHLRHRVSDERNTILVTGWQAPHTLGRKLVEGEKSVHIYGREYDVRARVEVLTGLSGHADREGLLAWASAMKRKPRRTFVIHGEEKSARDFARSLEAECGFEGIEIPDLNQTVSVTS
jgi:metallo-beta-lactamase family protein